MSNLVAAELRKARSIRTTWLLAAAALGFCALWTVVSVLTLDDPGQAGLGWSSGCRTSTRWHSRPTCSR